MEKTATPTLSDLSRQESRAFLARHNVGRLAFSFHDAVDIRPIHYVYDNGWIFGRTSPGEKLTTLRHNQWVAFEVDEIHGMNEWTSVIAHGTFFPTDAVGSDVHVQFHLRAVDAIRKLNPEALTEHDPMAFRTEVFAIHVDSLTGRSSSTEE